MDGVKAEWYLNGKKESEIKYVGGQSVGQCLIGMTMEIKKRTENYLNNILNGVLLIGRAMVGKLKDKNLKMAN